jgi:hypothetical protein
VTEKGVAGGASSKEGVSGVWKKGPTPSPEEEADGEDEWSYMMEFAFVVVAMCD